MKQYTKQQLKAIMDIAIIGLLCVAMAGLANYTFRVEPFYIAGAVGVLYTIIEKSIRWYKDNIKTPNNAS